MKKILKVCGVVLLVFIVGGFFLDGDEESTSDTVVTENKPVEKMTIGQKNAMKAAKNYLKTMPFSRQGLIDQLTSDYGNKFELEDAEWAITYLEENNLVDWNEEAVKAANHYLDTMPFSAEGLYDQLTSSAGSKFLAEEAQYAIDTVYQNE